VANGAGERPAKALSPALCLRVPIVLPLCRVFPRLASVRVRNKKKKRTATSLLFRRLPVCAVGAVRIG
jgi:hypothetical protein